MAPAAQPVPQPQQPTQTSLPLGVHYGGSAIPPASGVSGTGTFNGPWIIEQQSLNIEYVRVPMTQLTGGTGAIDVTLSSASMTHAVVGTSLAVRATASWSKVSAVAAYPLSGEYTQPQVFEFFPVSSDPGGVSYGDLNASTLGPMGTIATVLPYYHRRPMTNTERSYSDSESQYYLGLNSSACHGYNFALNDPSALNNTITMGNQSWYFNNYVHWAGSRRFRGAFLADNEYENALESGVEGFQAISTYMIPGAYSTATENLGRIYDTIDQVADAVHNYKLIRNGKLSANHEILMDQCLAEYNGTVPGLHCGYHNTFSFNGIGEYDKNRHDYSGAVGTP
jgi:hypothetical protein|tara:strand:- start:7500 stop:8513 length:1014 start_codon:yes stop_codon:yes gene_type:complete